MDVNNLAFVFLLIINCYYRTCCADPEGKPKGSESLTKLSGCEINLDQLVSVPSPGPRGEKGAKGSDGPVGEKGENGEPGLQGPKGQTGRKGDQGKDGFPGMNGEEGTQGPQGKTGDRGLKGDKGSVGVSGIQGLDGVCFQECPLDDLDDDKKMGINITANYLCNTKLGDYTFSGVTKVYPEDEFQVNCNNETKRTYIIIKPKDDKYIKENAINYKNETKPFWLSTFNNTSNRFSLTDFYNNVKLNQIAWIQQRSLQVSQTIRYHCKNSYINDNNATALRLLSWNDVPLGPDASDWSPISYSIPVSFHHMCKRGAPKDQWLYTDIIVRGSTKRLPVIDFYIKDIRGEDQSFFLELRELSFG